MKKKREKLYKFDARPHFNLMYFPQTQEGILQMELFWHKNWLIGVRPKITKVIHRLELDIVL